MAAAHPTTIVEHATSRPGRPPSDRAIGVAGTLAAGAPERLAATRRVADAAESDGSIWSLAAFWLVAFTSAALFAAVTIAPKWEAKERTAARVHALAAQCAGIAGTNQHLQRIIDAIKHDPEFTAEMARHELGYVVPGEIRLPAPPAHSRKGPAGDPSAVPYASARSRAPAPPPAMKPQPWAPYVRIFARDKLVRQAALVTAAVFLVVGLVCFNPRTERSA